ncbi:hypothetical protein O3P69_006211 [Scylla paramamosain]|uniref:Uncharacterized protein n=1 Tax=Scylla paramamosain TaxID=85552 RepID=A0AAW0U7C9_SCYPA
MDIASQFKVNESTIRTIKSNKQKMASGARGKEDRQAAMHSASNKEVERQVVETVSIAQGISIFDCITAQEFMDLVTAQQQKVSVEELMEETEEEEEEDGKTEHREQPKQLTTTNVKELMKLCELLKDKVMVLDPEIVRVHAAQEYINAVEEEELEQILAAQEDEDEVSNFDFGGFRSEAIQEVVDLLAETGMKDCNDWLSVLEDTEVNRIALACVVKYITRDKEVVKVTDNTINSAKALLPIISSKEVWIDLCRKESDMQGLIFEHHQYTELSLNHQYKHPDQVNHCDSLLCATPRCCLRVFKGHLSTAGTQLLQECQDLKVLHLAVCDQNAQGVLSVIRAIHPSLPRLSSLVLHIPIPAVRTDRCTMRLPDGLQVSLVLSGMNKKLLEKAARIAQALQPTMEGWRAIMFPGSSMTADVLQCLLEKLATAGVKVWSSVEGTLDGGILVPETSPITEEEERNLSSLAKTMSLGCLSRKSEDLMEVESL